MQDVLDAAHGSEVVSEPVVVQQPPVGAVEELDDVLHLQADPARLGSGDAFTITEALLVETFDQLLDRRSHQRAPPRTAAPVVPLLVVAVGDQGVRVDGPHLKPRPEEESLLGLGVGDDRLLPAELQLQHVPQERLNVVLGLLGQDLGPVTPTIQSSAYLMYLTLMKPGSNVSIDGRERICFVRARISSVMIPPDRFNARCLR